ncbi:methyl-accepting chemotaxis protein [Pokkaliibacter sp. CJK22405]|uniref:methyl-accepting chemotaxis protein n=1 Tax=Pokkaliibacter sp. CJK22405 TaxID=3384615 RepID=UPI0039853AEB
MVTNEIIARLDLKGNLTYVNQGFCQVTGYDAKSLMGNSMELVRHSDVPAGLYEQIWSSLQMGRPWEGVTKIQTKSGGEAWLKVNVVPATTNGRVTEYIYVATMATDEQIRGTETRFSRIRQGSATLTNPKDVLSKNLMKQWYINLAAVVVLAIVITIATVELLPPEWLEAVVFLSLGVFAFRVNQLMTRQVKGINEIAQAMTEVAEGDYYREIDTMQSGEIGALKRSLKALGTKLGFEIAYATERNNEMTRIKQSLDNVTSNVMLANENNIIIYCNRAVNTMLKRAESQIRRDLPHFNVDTLVGANIDVFHKDPSHQRRMLSALSTTFRTKIAVGGRNFSLTANPVNDESGNRLGTVVEWEDVTEQMRAERQIEDLIARASQGELDERLKPEEYEGFMGNVAGGINKLLDAVVEPMSEVRRVLISMSQGDVNQRMEGVYKGDFLEVSNALNSSMERITQLAMDIKAAGDTITAGASEIAQGNVTLSQRTEEQAASIEETSASMEEMTGTVRRNADNAQEASLLAAEAKKLAEEGGGISSKAVVSMGSISQSSSRISDIIGVIDEIAFQTNLLALNAAVEAARAGEQGRGFAVVASEVRSLAQRSATAAKEIKQLINESVKTVAEGASYVDESGKSLQRIIDSVERVSQIISEIAIASQEQATGISQVNVAITQMDEGTQQNAALVEEVAAASESMASQAQGLQTLVSFFKLGEMDDDLMHAPHVPAARKASTLSASPKYEKPKAAKPAVTEKPVERPKMKVEAHDEWEEF